MGSIATFYSYKGGVGRSMALANVALVLARRGLKVMAVDFDLEAPGLERYFNGYFEIRPGGPGLMRMFMDAQADQNPDYREFTSEIDCKTIHPLVLLSSGREQDEHYSKNLETFDWGALFSEHGGGDFVERLRNRWREDFDIVLVDSRTGLSDTGGICTIQLPDIVVAMFTANYQSLYGVRDVMRLAQEARQRLAYDRMPLTILPLPARWGTQEFSETQVWLSRIAEAVGEFCSDWLPKPGHARDVVEQLKIPQRDYFGFGEKLAVVEQGTSDPSGMGHAYDRIASILASDFTKINLAFASDSETASTSGPGSSSSSSNLSPTQVSAADWQYDVYVGYETAIAEQVQTLVEAIRKPLAEQLEREATIFLDLRELEVGDQFVARTRDAYTNAHLLLALVSPRYFQSRHRLEEWWEFEGRSKELGRPLIVTAMMRGPVPDGLRDYPMVDLRDQPTTTMMSKQNILLAPKAMLELVSLLAQMIKSDPPVVPARRVSRTRRMT